MKIYTNTIDLANPSDKKFWVAPYSDFAIGIKFVANGEDVEGTVVLKDRDGDAMTADEQKYGDGFTVFKTTSGRGEKTDVYTAVAPNGQETIIIQNTSDSTVFEKDETAAGIDLTNYYTKDEVDSEITTLEDALEDKQDAGDYVESDGIITNLKSISQADYDALVTAGTVDENTLYVIAEEA